MESSTALIASCCGLIVDRQPEVFNSIVHGAKERMALTSQWVDVFAREILPSSDASALYPFTREAAATAIIWSSRIESFDGDWRGGGEVDMWVRALVFWVFWLLEMGCR